MLAQSEGVLTLAAMCRGWWRRRQLGEEWATVAVVVSESTDCRGAYTQRQCVHTSGGEGGWEGVRGEGSEVVIMSGVVRV